MLLSHDCGYAIRQWGVEASESVRVTKKGSELFCNLSRELHIKG